MSLQMIYLGQSPNDTLGTPMRSGGAIINANFLEIGQALGITSTGSGAIINYGPQTLAVTGSLTLSGATQVLATGMIVLGGGGLPALYAASPLGTITVSGSPISSTATTLNLDLASVTGTLVTGSYTNAAISVDKFGRIITASSGSAGAGTVTLINTASGVGGGPITASGTLYFDPQALTASTAAPTTSTYIPTTTGGTAFKLRHDVLLGTWTGAVNGAAQKLSDPLLSDVAITCSSVSTASNYTADYTSANVFRITATGNIILAFSNWPASGNQGSVEVVFIQDSTGARTLTVTGSVKWASGAAPTLASATGSVTRLGFVTEDGGTTVNGNLIGSGYA